MKQTNYTKSSKVLFANSSAPQMIEPVLKKEKEQRPVGDPASACNNEHYPNPSFLGFRLSLAPNESV